MRLFAEQIRALVPRRYVVLGTDGFGRSDTREKLRYFFEVNPQYVTVAALKALADDGAIPAAKVAEAIAKYGLDPDEAGAVDRADSWDSDEHDRRQGPRHRRLQGHPGHRSLREAGRQRCKADDSLVTLESDKATMDVPSPAAGVVKELKVKVGDKVSEGTLVLTLGGSDAPAAQATHRRPHPRPASAPSPQPSPASGRGSAQAPPRSTLASSPLPAGEGPGVRELRSTTKRSPRRTRRRRCASSRASSASTSADVKGTGPNGRILQEDVQAS